MAEWTHVDFRRYLVYLEQSLDQGTLEAVFEPIGCARRSGPCTNGSG
jgi:hypothetical protein